MRRQSDFSSKPLNERLAYLEAVKAFFKQSVPVQQAADKQGLVTSNKRS